MRRRGLELLLHGMKDIVDVLHMNNIAMGVEHFDKAAHVGAFEFLRQIDEHANSGDGVLDRVSLVAHLDRKAKSTNADLIDAEFAMIALTLLVVQFPAGLPERPRGPISISFKHSMKVNRNAPTCQIFVDFSRWGKLRFSSSNRPIFAPFMNPQSFVTASGVMLILLSWQSVIGETFRVATYNLENYLDEPTQTRFAKSAESKARISDSILELKPDVIALQEIGTVKALEELRTAIKAGGLDLPYWEHVAGADTNVHVAILSRFPFTAKRPRTNDNFLLNGRRLRVSRGFGEVDVQVNKNYSFTLITAHLKSKRPVPQADEVEIRLEEAKLLREEIDSRFELDPNVNLVVLGDFNDTRDSPSTKAVIGRGRRKLLDTRPAEREGDSDADASEEARKITWTHYYSKEDTYARIDYILLSPGMAREWVRNGTYVLRMRDWGIASDHRPVVATFEAEDK